MNSIAITALTSSLIFLTPVGYYSDTRPQSLGDITAKAVDTTVYFSIDYYDKRADSVKTDAGTGVIISEDGDVLTDYHVVRGWIAQDEKNKESHPLFARIGSRFSAPLIVGIEMYDEHADIALLKIRVPQRYRAAPICYNAGLVAGDFLLAFGYPNNTEFTPVAGTFSNPNGDDNRWMANIPISPGMSGGPVYNDQGYVVGLVEGGADTATNTITPLRWARSIIQDRTNVHASCFRACRLPDNGVENWGITSPWTGTSEWVSGGHNKQEMCNALQNEFLATHQTQLLDITNMSEQSRKDFLGHVTYQYTCNGTVHANPTYVERVSPACGRDE